MNVAPVSTVLFTALMLAAAPAVAQTPPPAERTPVDFTRDLNALPPGARPAPLPTPAPAPVAAPATVPAASPAPPAAPAARPAAPVVAAPPAAVRPAPATVTAPAAVVRPAPAPSAAAPAVRPAPAPAPRPAAPPITPPSPVAQPPVARPAPASVPPASPAPAPAPAPVPAPAPAPVPAPEPPAFTVLDAPARAALPFALTLPQGVQVTTGRPGPNFRIYSVRRGETTLAMIYVGEASQFPIYSGQMVEAGGRASVVASEDGRRVAVEHLFQRATSPREIHVWIASVEGADRLIAESIAQSVDPR